MTQIKFYKDEKNKTFLIMKNHRVHYYFHHSFNDDNKVKYIFASKGFDDSLREMKVKYFLKQDIFEEVPGYNCFLENFMHNLGYLYKFKVSEKCKILKEEIIEDNCDYYVNFCRVPNSMYEIYFKNESDCLKYKTVLTLLGIEYYD